MTTSVTTQQAMATLNIVSQMKFVPTHYNAPPVITTIPTLVTPFDDQEVPNPEVKKKKVKERVLPPTHTPQDDKFFNEIPDILPVQGKKWFQNQKAMFTYKTHLDKVKVEEWFRSKCSAIKFFRVAHETGDDANPYLHSHILVDFGKAFQSMSVSVFDYDGIHPNIKKVLTAVHWRRCVNYLSKEDKTNSDLYSQLDPIATIQSYSDPVQMLTENIFTMSQIKNVPAMLQVHAMRKDEDCTGSKPLKRLKRWQFQLYSQLIAERSDEDSEDSSTDSGSGEDTPYSFPTNTDGRNITLIYDPQGGNGKTKFGDYMMRLRTPDNVKRFHFIQGLGQSRDIAEVIKNAINGGWTGETLIINLPREQCDHKIYGTLESIIDGNITSMKYSGKTLTFPIRHVVVLTNVMLNLKAVTLNRWIIHTIHSTTKKLCSMSIEEALAHYESHMQEKLDTINSVTTIQSRMGVVPTFEGIRPIRK